MNGAIGTEGFVAWFYAIVYNYIRRACKNFLIKLFVHSIGLTLIIIGLIQKFLQALRI